MNFRILAAAAAALILGACMPNTATGPDDGPASPTTVPGTQAACETGGGIWRAEGRLGLMTCVMPHADAGQPCTDSDQCAGDCRLGDDKRPAEGEPVTGICQANTSNFGCFTRVEDGRAAATLCVD
ncbi:MAG: hypothetical protein ACK4FB_07210 [Brevundimonas sp.]|uniref:hypothetical protein n=1 Tax=Brevundimonas sp. TaxID=1871086 RepID=UPI0039196247